MPVNVEDRVSKSSKKNQKFFYDYLEFEVNVKEAKESSLKNYRSTIVNFYEYINHEEIDSTPIERIEEFLLQIDNIRTFTNKLNNLKSFFSYLNNVTRLPFEINELHQLMFPREEIRNAEKREAIPLSIEELVMLRNKLEKNKDYKKLFTLEMLYYYGLNPTEVSQCNINSYDKEKKIFQLKDKKIEINERILNLFSFNGVLLPLTRSAVIYRLSEIGALLNRPLTPSDIAKTRDLYFFTCPSCKKGYENNPKNWAILEYYIDHSKWMVCKYCAVGEYNE